MKRIGRLKSRLAVALLVAGFAAFAGTPIYAEGAEPASEAPTFSGAKTTWNG